MTVGSVEQLRVMLQNDANCDLMPELYDWYYTADKEDVLKAAPVVGDGSCVLLVQSRSGVPSHGFWRKGPLVKGNSGVPYGTAIAAGWDDKGLYPSHEHHNHAAIFLRESSDGLIVIDQWPGIDTKRFRPHDLRFGNTRNAPSNDGNAFYVILTPRQHR